MDIALRARRGKVVTGAQGLIGEVGVARTSLSPDGKVFVHGELWDAVSSVNLDEGQTVIVRGVEGLRLQVDPVTAAQPTHVPAPI
jgi:membrane-bound serine protease (ClpP class)